MRIALGQLSAGTDPAANLDLVRDLVARSVEQAAEIVLLPEATMSRFGVALESVAQRLDGPWANELRAIAHGAGVTVVAGMFTPSGDGRVRNTTLVTGPGLDVHYDKLHLFDAFGFAESDTVAPGTEPVVCTIGGLTFGLATCYDLRFPGLFQVLADRGAHVMLVGASWGAGPGKREQWELLCRARALDSTSWLLACGQADPLAAGRAVSGRAPTGIGHSLAVSPWGEVRACLDERPGLLVVDVDAHEVTEARQAIPVLANRRF